MYAQLATSLTVTYPLISQATLGEVYGLLGTFIVTAGTIAVAWITRQQRQIAETQKKVVKQLTENGGQNDPPTVPDRFHGLHETLLDVREHVLKLHEGQVHLAERVVRLERRAEPALRNYLDQQSKPPEHATPEPPE